MSKVNMLLIVLLAVLVQSCSGGGGAENDKNLLDDGSPALNVLSVDGKVSLSIPAGALPENVTISDLKIEPVAAPDLQNVDIVLSYQFSPDNLQFKKPVTLTFSDDNIPAGAKIIFVGADSYQEIATTVNAQTGALVGEITHFSIYIVATDEVVAKGQLSIPELQSAKASGGVVSLTWKTPINGADSYNVYWKNQAGVTKDANKISNVGSKVDNADAAQCPNGCINYRHVELTNRIGYFYKISYLKDGIESELSNELNSMPQLRAFITSVKGKGKLGSWPDAGGKTGLEAGDAICNTRAALAGMEGNFKAWLSDRTDDAYCRVHGLSGTKAANCGQDALPEFAGPWVRTDGELLGLKIGDLLNNRRQFTILNHDEFGKRIVVTDDLQGQFWIYSGTNPLGSAADGVCNDWASDTAPDRGWLILLSGSLAKGLEGACEAELPIYCFETGDGGGQEYVRKDGLIVFISSATGTGNLSEWAQANGKENIAAGDEICNTLAKANDLEGNFVAWLSYPNAKDRIASDGPWVSLDGIMIAKNKAELISGKLSAPISMMEDGNYIEDNFYVMTNTNEYGMGVGDSKECTPDPDGDGDSYHCNHWSSKDPKYKIVMANPTLDGYAWTYNRDHGETDCSSKYHIYCFQSELGDPTIPKYYCD